MQQIISPSVRSWVSQVTVHTVSCTCCTASGQFSDGAGIQPLAVRRLFNGLDALQFAAGWAVNCNVHPAGKCDGSAALTLKKF